MKHGIQVKVNYHGTIDGKIFDSSIDKDWLKTQKRKAEPIVFKVDANYLLGFAARQPSVANVSRLHPNAYWVAGRDWSCDSWGAYEILAHHSIASDSRITSDSRVWVIGAYG